MFKYSSYMKNTAEEENQKKMHNVIKYPVQKNTTLLIQFQCGNLLLKYGAVWCIIQRLHTEPLPRHL